jgi:hypothetical protein
MGRLVEKPLEFEPFDGLVYITNPETGDVSAMRRTTFYASFHNAAKCIQQCHRDDGAEIVPFSRPEEVASA